MCIVKMPEKWRIYGTFREMVRVASAVFIGVTNAAIHIALGLGISFAGPIVAAWIMKKTKWLELERNC